MMEFESDLRRVLGSRDVPPGLAERILERLGRQDPGEGHRPRRRSRRIWLVAAGIGLALGLTGLLRVERHREEERARQELMVGLRITGATLRQIQERISALEVEPSKRSQ